MLKTSTIASALAGAALCLAPMTAPAHVTLETAEVAVGSYYKAVFDVPHGCDGHATVALRVKIPEGVIAVKPRPKPGWTLSKETGPYATPYAYHGTELTEGVTEISWTGGPLADDEFDEFTMQMYLTDTLTPGDTLFFPAVQECEGDTVARWIEIPDAGESAHDLDRPAPGVTLLPAD